MRAADLAQNIELGEVLVDQDLTHRGDRASEDVPDYRIAAAQRRNP
jgi:hypothetical protein